MNHKLTSLTFTTIALITAGACATDSQDEQERLQSLLHDEPLAHVPSGAASSSAAAGASAAKATGAHSNIILPSVNPVGVWNFDDCTPSRTNLLDATSNNNTAFRSVGVTCTSGIEGSQAVQFANTEDLIYVPDQPNFTFENGVTVAGWFKPTTLGGTKTLFRRRDKGTSSFALLLDAGKFEFVVNLGNNTAISVSAPKKAKTGVFQHVAATYDGTTARLYVDGFEVNSFASPGTIPVGPGPLLMGNDGSERRFAGAIDSALFTTHALTAEEVQDLTCSPQSPSMVVTPTNLATPPGVPAQIDIALTNHSSAACAPITFSLQTFDFDSRLGLDPSFAQSAPVPSGTTGHMAITATPSASVGPGNTFFVEFLITEPTTGFFNFGFEDLTVTQPVIEGSACVAGASCTVDLSGCTEDQKAQAWQGQSTLQGTLELASYTSHTNWVCQTPIPQAWPIVPEPGWWCGTVVNQCTCSPADACR